MNDGATTGDRYLASTDSLSVAPKLSEELGGHR